MPDLMAETVAKALKLRVPLSVHLDLTYRCNQDCIHCYVDHTGTNELPTGEVLSVLDQLAEAGSFFLIFSGGEPFVRPDIFEIITHARSLHFQVSVKSNGVLIGEREAKRLSDLHVANVCISIYSHRAEVHDAITQVPGSLERSLKAVRLLRSHAIKVRIVNIVMASNRTDYPGVKALAAGLGADFSIDPTITPHMSHECSLAELRLPQEDLSRIVRDASLVARPEEFCAPAPLVSREILDEIPCSAGHTACYISPSGKVYPCVQFPLLAGDLRQQRFLDIWRRSPQLESLRLVHNRDLPRCSACRHLPICSRCPGLAYMEGDLRGISSLDCEKSEARSGLPAGPTA